MQTDDNASVTSDRSTTSSVASSVAKSVLSAILDANPRSHIRRNVAKRARQLDDEEEQISTGMVCVGNADNDSRSVSNASALSKLDHDEVSIRDAVDAKSLAGTSPLDQHLGGKREMSYWEGSFDSLLEVAEPDPEMKRIVRLATPFVAASLVEGVLEAVNVAIVGRFMGTASLSAYVTVDMLIGLSASVFGGFHESLTTLCSQAIGAGNKKLAGQYLQIAMVLYVICYTPLIVFWMVYMEDVLRWFKFEEETVTVGVEFGRVYLFVELVEAVAEALHALLDIIEKEFYSAVTKISIQVLATLGVLVVSLGPTPSLERVGLAYLLASAGGMFINVLIIMWKGWLDPYLGGIIGSFALAVSNVILCLKVRFGDSLNFLISVSHQNANRTSKP